MYWDLGMVLMEFENIKELKFQFKVGQKLNWLSVHELLEPAE